MDRWDEYNDGALTPPAIVQHDVVGGEHLIWGWTGYEGDLSGTWFRWRSGIFINIGSWQLLKR